MYNQSNSQQKKENINNVTKKQLNRRSKILLLLIKGQNNSQIANELKISRSTINSDVTVLAEDMRDWTNNLALVAWMKQIEKMYIESCESIDNIIALQETIQKEISEEKFTWDPNPFNPESQSEEYLKFENIKSKAFSAFCTRVNQYSEFAQLENAKTKTKELLIGMTTHIPLFAATQRLAIYYSQNEQKKQDNTLPPLQKPQQKVLKKLN